jgi:hypothetical protein
MEMNTQIRNGRYAAAMAAAYAKAVLSEIRSKIFETQLVSAQYGE